MYKTYQWIKKYTKKFYHVLFDNVKLTLKWSIFYGAFVFLLMLFFVGIHGGETFFVLLSLVMIGVVFFITLNRIREYEIIQRSLEALYKNGEKIYLEEEKFKKPLKDTAKYVNNIADGFENAIEEGIKSERLKTELITNVSHDIKTPLTSIINYVGLLKQEKLQNEKAKEYVEILDSKSQRLKKLIEDLVEASKASSGNIKLDRKKIVVGELLKQATGEFEEKFKEKNLEIIMNLPEEEVSIYADSRYMYRIIENLFVNVSKYAQSHSRVYVDVTLEGVQVKISIKNISEERLNIPAEELMQRFVRGDRSRTTEGSGLGISIAKSLTELQKGQFILNIDGDLFKVELIFEKL